MSATGSVRDAIPARTVQAGDGGIAGACSVQVIGSDADNTSFYPSPGGLHTVATAAAGRTWTITNASKPLPYELPIGVGFQFSIQNNGANTITLAVAGTVAAGAGTLTVPTNRTRIFCLSRTTATVYKLDTLGVLTH